MNIDESLFERLVMSQSLKMQNCTSLPKCLQLMGFSSFEHEETHHNIPPSSLSSLQAIWLARPRLLMLSAALAVSASSLYNVSFPAAAAALRQHATHSNVWEHLPKQEINWALTQASCFHAIQTEVWTIWVFTGSLSSSTKTHEADWHHRLPHKTLASSWGEASSLRYSSTSLLQLHLVPTSEKKVGRGGFFFPSNKLVTLLCSVLSIASSWASCCSPTRRSQQVQWPSHVMWEQQGIRERKNVSCTTAPSTL